MKIYVWGTGCAAGDLIDTGLAVQRVTAFLDSEARGSFLGRPVIRPEAADTDREYLVLVASRHVEEIARQAAACGIGKDRLLFLRNNWTLTDRNTDYGKARELLPPAVLASPRTPPRAIRPLPSTPGSPLTERDLEGDYVRVRTLELLCAQLEDVPGAAAELGVYRGSFARCLSALLPERTLYLFDSFEGFDPTEAQGQGEGFVQAHRNTAAERVLGLLPHPEKAVIRQGLFPATAEGIEERFALVSLDVDLEESTLAGLRFFLPRISEGGCMLLHDYNNLKLPGVKAALRRYEEEQKIRLRKVPLCDLNGTLVISL